MRLVAVFMDMNVYKECIISSETHGLLTKLVEKKNVGFQQTLKKAWKRYLVSEKAILKYIKFRYPIWYFRNRD